MFSSPFVIIPHILKKTKVLQPKAAEEPRATSVSMFGAPCSTDLKPLVKNRLLMIITIAARIICVSESPR